MSVLDDSKFDFKCPDPIISFAPAAVTGTSVRVEWSPVQDASNYVIEVCDLISECDMNLEKRFSTRVLILKIFDSKHMIFPYYMNHI